MHDDFKEIDFKGGTFTFMRDGVVAYSFSKPEHLVLTHRLHVSFNGFILGVSGFGTEDFPYPSIEVIMNPDREDLYGRKCPNCKEYFRAKSCRKYMYCPYCVYRGNSIEFLTEAQLNFVKIFLQKFHSVMISEAESETVEIDDLIRTMQDNNSQFKLLDERQQLKVECDKCKNIFDIMGHYGFCSSCRASNIVKSFHEHLNKDSLTVSEIVTNFQSLGNHIKKNILIRLPGTKDRRKKISKINYQRIDTFPDMTLELCGIDLMKGVNDYEFIKAMYAYRHIENHQNRIVDQEFLDEAGEYWKNNGYPKLRINQHFRFEEQKHKEYLGKFASAIKKMAFNLLFGVEEILDARDEIELARKIIVIN